MSPLGLRPSVGAVPNAVPVVEEVLAVDDELAEAVAQLLPQLSQSASALGRHELDALVADRAVSLFVARLDSAGPIVAMGSLVTFRIPTGVRSWIEDVVVDDRATRRGVGEAMIRALVERARVVGARSVDLTSRPSRATANRLYQRVGFQRRETNVYRMYLDGQ